MKPIDTRNQFFDVWNVYWPIALAVFVAIAALVVSGLLLVWFLDHPYENRSGSIKPVEITRSLRYMEQKETTSAESVRPPCDNVGRPLPS